jgi:hypothetical protein
MPGLREQSVLSGQERGPGAVAHLKRADNCADVAAHRAAGYAVVIQGVRGRYASESPPARASARLVPRDTFWLWRLVP